MRSTTVPKRAKRLRYSHRAQRRHRAQKVQKKEEKRLANAGQLDRNDQRLRHQKRVVPTLSQLIVPRASHSGQKEPKVHRKKEQPQPQQMTKTAKKNAQKEMKKQQIEKNRLGGDGVSAESNALEKPGTTIIQAMAGGKGEGKKATKGGGGERQKGKGAKKKETAKTAEAAMSTECNGHAAVDLAKSEADAREVQQQNGYGQGMTREDGFAGQGRVQMEEEEEQSRMLAMAAEECADALTVSIDMLPQGKQQNGMETPLTVDRDQQGICSVDSGVDAGNDGPCASMHRPNSSSESSSKCLEPNGTALKSNAEEQQDNQQKMELTNGNALNDTNSDTGRPKVAKFEQRLCELVGHVQEQIHFQTALLAGNEQAAPLSTPLKVEPLNLERIKLLETTKREKRPRLYKLLDSDIQYCRYMEQNYGEDYEAMSRDPRNVFGDSASSMRRKLRTYKDFLKQNNEWVAV